MQVTGISVFFQRRYLSAIVDPRMNEIIIELFSHVAKITFLAKTEVQCHLCRM